MSESTHCDDWERDSIAASSESGLGNNSNENGMNSNQSLSINTSLANTSNKSTGKKKKTWCRWPEDAASQITSVVDMYMNQGYAATALWDKVSEHFGGISPSACSNKWRYEKRKLDWMCEDGTYAKSLVPDPLAKKSRKINSDRGDPYGTKSGRKRPYIWSLDEFRLLEESVEELKKEGLSGNNLWDKVSERLGGNVEPVQCMNKYNYHHPKWKPRLWNDSDTARLSEVVEEIRKNDIKGSELWEKVSEAMGGSFSAKQCETRYRSLSDRSDRPQQWTQKDVSDLRHAVDQYKVAGYEGAVLWEEVSKRMSGRPPSECRQKYEALPREKRSTVTWREADTRKLCEAVESCKKDGMRHTRLWASVSEEMGGRWSASACEQKWRSVAGYESTKWSEEDCAALAQAVEDSEAEGLTASKLWERVSELLGAKYTPRQCSHEYHRANKARSSQCWSEEAEQNLKAAVESYKYLGYRNQDLWNKVSEHLGVGWSARYCKYRHQHSVTTKPPLSECNEELGRLKVIVEIHKDLQCDETVFWDSVSRHMGPKWTPERCCKNFEVVTQKVKSETCTTSGDCDTRENGRLEPHNQSSSEVPLKDVK
mmetsp:Transcript_10751/g.16332  ORF Transcript_10751/g.16332 Transcript_10751/m.16332 type:complete len:596 (+) Transcript_10751:74-1861(+)